MNKVVNIKVPLRVAFNNYLLLTRPFNKLTDREASVLALLLYYNETYKPNFKLDKDRWDKVFHYDTKLKIREELGIEDYTLQNVLTGLRKKKAVINNVIPQHFIPEFDDQGRFRLIYNFQIDG
ncbi:MAG: hypothetical protein N4A76_00980 [Firmicutes bacterium]|jgi:hypothetical protein|nr:hypothetical protein [Bacillota bacterium]